MYEVLISHEAEKYYKRQDKDTKQRLISMNNKSKILKSKPQVIMKNGRPNAVIIDIKDYKKLLERLEDKEDLTDLVKMRKGSLRFRKFDDFLADRNNAL